jgi:hemerythrin-like metal-binding protein
MATIRWRSQMAIDHGIIDDDHRHLIDIINRFGEHLERGTPGIGDALGVLDSLKAYAETHFEREELLQKLVGYPEHEAHHEAHVALRARLGEIIASAHSATDAGAAHVRKELNGLLREWLLTHVLRVDVGMRPYAPLMLRQVRRLPHLRDLQPEAQPSR